MAAKSLHHTMDEHDFWLSTEAQRLAFQGAIEELSANPWALYAADPDALAAAALFSRALAMSGCKALAAGSAWARGSVPVAAPVVTFEMPPQPGDVWHVTAPQADGTALHQQLASCAVRTWELCGPLADLSNLDWLAAMGCVLRVGSLPVAWLRHARARHTAKFIRLAAQLCYAACRADDLTAALGQAMQLLEEAPDPRSLVNDGRAEVLKALQSEMETALRVAHATQPVYRGRLAFYPVRCQFRIEDLLAQRWAELDRRHVVLVANSGQGQVRYETRSCSGMKPDDYLRSVGCTMPTRGEMPMALWLEALARVGFS